MTMTMGGCELYCKGMLSAAPDPSRLAQAHTTCVQQAIQANHLRLGPEPNPHHDPSLQQSQALVIVTTRRLRGLGTESAVLGG